MGAGDRRFQIIGDENRWTALEKLEGPDVGTDPVRGSLRPGGFRVGVATGAQHRDEDLGMADLASPPIHDLDGESGVVHEQLLAGAVLLAHHDIELACPGPILVAEPAVMETFGVGGLVLVPQQRERYALAAQLAMNMAPIRNRALC